MQVIWLKCRQDLALPTADSSGLGRALPSQQSLLSAFPAVPAFCLPSSPCFLPSQQSLPQHGTHMLLTAPEVLQPTPEYVLDHEPAQTKPSTWLQTHTVPLHELKTPLGSLLMPALKPAVQEAADMQASI